MAKTRSGLGRGLGSLLGGGPEGGLPDPPAPPAIPEEKKEEESAEIDQKETVDESSEELNINTEDNVTIKRVVERKASAAPVTVDDVRLDLEVLIDDIEPNPDQPRTNFKKEELEELAESIKKNGLLSPILVRKKDDKYQIIAGERRWQACKSLGMKKVPVRIKEADDEETIILALVENIQRSNLNPIEEAYGYRRMMERGKMTQSEVAQAVSKGRTTITNALRLLELPEDAQQLLFEEKITAGHARAILSVPTKEGRRKLIDRILKYQLSVRDAENFAKILSGKKIEDKQPRTPAPKSYKTVARALSDSLATEVKIKSSRGTNKIEISFKDESELQRLFRQIARPNS